MSTLEKVMKSGRELTTRAKLVSIPVGFGSQARAPQRVHVAAQSHLAWNFQAGHRPLEHDEDPLLVFPFHRY